MQECKLHMKTLFMKSCMISPSAGKLKKIIQKGEDFYEEFYEEAIGEQIDDCAGDCAGGDGMLGGRIGFADQV